MLHNLPWAEKSTMAPCAVEKRKVLLCARSLALRWPPTASAGWGEQEARTMVNQWPPAYASLQTRMEARTIPPWVVHLPPRMRPAQCFPHVR